MATFHKRGDYQWQAKIRRKGYPTQSKTFETKADAEAWARSIESGMDSGTYRPLGESQKTIVGGLLERYSKEVTPLKRGRVQEQSKLRVIGSYPIAQYAITNIGGKELSTYRDARLKEVTPATVNKELTLIGHVFSVAIKDWGMVLPRGNPINEVRKPKEGNTGRKRRLLQGEEARLLAALEEYGDGTLAAFFGLALETGIRRSEMSNMQWDRHVRLSRRIIHLTADITKTEEERDVPLSNRAMAIMEALPRRSDGNVFGSHPNSVTRGFAKACKRAGIKGLCLHDIRHEATSRLFEKGLNQMQVASITGHQSLQMLKRYTHLKAEDLVEMLG